MIFFEKSWCGNLVLTEKAVYLHSEMMEIWSDGRGVRHWSAKPFTAVRIRFRPHSFKERLCKSSIYEGVFLFFTYRFTYRLGLIDQNAYNIDGSHAPTRKKRTYQTISDIITLEIFGMEKLPARKEDLSSDESSFLIGQGSYFLFYFFICSQIVGKSAVSPSS